jgi:hypothetical protein
LLTVFETALRLAPLSEIWRQSQQLAVHSNTSAGRLAIALAAWLWTGEDSAAAAACTAFLACSPDEEEQTRFCAFLDAHCGRHLDDFFYAMLEATPSLYRLALRGASRSSKAYRNALLMLGAEILQS